MDLGRRANLSAADGQQRGTRQKNWGLGPEFVILHLEHDDPWVDGAIVNNSWSLTSNKQGGSYSNDLIQPFVNYNVPNGDALYFTSSPIWTVDWNANGQRWTIPLGGGVGMIFHLGKLPVNTQISAYYNVVKPEFGPNWQIRAQVQLMSPKRVGSTFSSTYHGGLS